MSARVRLSAAPIDWGVAELVPGNPDSNEMLDWVAGAGYTGCELGTHGYFGFSPEEVLNHFQPRELAVTASWYDVDLSQPLMSDAAADIDLIASLMEAGGATVLNISDKIVPERAAVVGRVPSFPNTRYSNDAWQQLPKTLTQIHELIAPHGVRVAFHFHVATHIEDADEVRRLVDALAGTPIDFCIDTGHLLLGGVDPIALLKELGRRVIHIHAKDVDGDVFARVKAGEIDYFSATGQGLYCDLGNGIVDWQGLRRELDALDYAGWVVAEQDRLLVPGSRIPFDANTRNQAFLAGLFGV